MISFNILMPSFKNNRFFAKKYDIFLSYRVKDDKDLVEKIYFNLEAAHFKVFLDAKCLQDAQSWEEGFLEGLKNSAIFMPIITINTFPVTPNPDYQDNVLLEYESAIALLKAKKITAIFPVLVGTINASNKNVYDNYFATVRQKYTFPPDLVMKQNKIKLRRYCETWNIPANEENMGLSLPDIFNEFYNLQAFLFEGTFDPLLKDLSLRLNKIIPRPNIAPASSTVTSSETMNRKENHISQPEMVEERYCGPKSVMILFCPYICLGLYCFGCYPLDTRKVPRK